MIGATRGTQYQIFATQHKPLFRPNQKVRLKDRPTPYTVTSIQRIQVDFCYELKEIDGIYVKERCLKPFQEEKS